MAKGNRKVPEINSSSTADIAFLLLIFFLITTSMDTARGFADLSEFSESADVRWRNC